jgi:hypothetical protein
LNTEPGPITARLTGVPPAPGPEEFRKSAVVPAEVDLLRRDIEDLQKRVSEAEKGKERLAEFDFQTMTVLLGILTLAVAVPFAFLYGSKVTSHALGCLITSLLVADTVLAIIWMVLWTRLNFRSR